MILAHQDKSINIALDIRSLQMITRLQEGSSLYLVILAAEEQRAAGRTGCSAQAIAPLPLHHIPSGLHTTTTRICEGPVRIVRCGTPANHVKNVDECVSEARARAQLTLSIW